MTDWDYEDTKNYNGASSKEISRAEHKARDDAEKAGVFKRGDDAKNRQRFSRNDESGKKAQSFWDGIFGG